MESKEEKSPGKHASSPPQEEHKSPKKRRKVNHACIYCRRSHMTCDLERPCNRCIKRSIGHLCHDEPRDSGKARGEHESLLVSDGATSESTPFAQSLMGPPLDGSSAEQQFLGTVGANVNMSLPTSNIGQSLPPPLPPTSDLPVETQSYEDPNQSFLNYGNWGMGNPDDMNSLYPHYLFNAPDIGSEYSVLNNFLNTNLLDEGSLFTSEDVPYSSDQALNTQLPGTAGSEGGSKTETMQSAPSDGPGQPFAIPRGSVSRSKSIRPTDKEDEKFYLNIADPSGNDKPEERMKKLLEAKFAAGLLRPFNYIQGYARLNAYLENHMQPALRQRMMRQIEKFRPKFREKMKSLTDMELTMVEMWFEKTLMEYDRVFASMAIPACCWRRTGEIFRGNKEMAKLIRIPVDKLRDGQLALHEIMAEKDLVNYWNNFLKIAFDNSQKAMLTTCTLQVQDPKAENATIKCCFSFTVRRDAQHNIPSLIVGNFLPQIGRQA